MITRRDCMAAVPAVAAAFYARLASAADSTSFSEAERMLFTQDHFKSLKEATQIEYEYRVRGSLEEEFVDHVRLAVSKKKPSGKHDVQVDFLSGARKMDLPPVEDVEGNPVILYFLEREVREMNRQTGGSSNYYRKRIRIVLAENAVVKPVAVTVSGKPVQAREIFIAPYREDPARVRYEKFAEKTFHLTLSDQVPGSIVEMRSELLEPVSGGQPTLVRAESLNYIGRR